jgi:ABC-2 type transport system ATP-binding protein
VALTTRPIPRIRMTLAVEIRNVTKRFQEHVAVRGLDLTVPRGAVYGLLGPNGAGKTTTIRMILNIIAPDAGTISIFGRSHLEYGVTDRVGYLPEERGLYKKMQVRRVLRFLGELKGLSGGDAERRATEWLERLGLKTAEKDWGLSKIDELSRGMQQKVQFIAALLHDPDLVILDEPFSGLDPINAQALKDTVVDLKQRGKTVIFSTHVMETAERMCDAVCIIARGEKVLDGPVAQVKAEHGTRNVAVVLQDGARRDSAARVLADRALVSRVDDSNRAFEIELAPGADAQRLLRQLVDTGAAIERFELVHPSLHQIFLQRVGAANAAGIERSGAEAEVPVRG